MMAWGQAKRMSQAQGMVEEEQVGGAKRNYQTAAIMVPPKTIPAPSGRDGAKEGILRNHCENPVDEGKGNEKAGEGLFKMPRPKGTKEVAR